MNSLSPARLTSLRRWETARVVALGVSAVVALFAWASMGCALHAHANTGCLASCIALGSATTILGLYLVHVGRRPFRLTQMEEYDEIGAEELREEDYDDIYVFQHHLLEGTQSVTVSKDVVDHLHLMRTLTKKAGRFACPEGVCAPLREDMAAQHQAEKMAFVDGYNPSLIKHLLRTGQSYSTGVNLFEKEGQKYLEALDHLTVPGTGQYVMRRRTLRLDQNLSPMKVEYSLPLDSPHGDLTPYFTKN